MTSLPALLTTTEVANALRAHPETVRRWVRDGRLLAIELPGGMLRFRREDIERLLGMQVGESDIEAVAS